MDQFATRLPSPSNCRSPVKSETPDIDVLLKLNPLALKAYTPESVAVRHAVGSTVRLPAFVFVPLVPEKRADFPWL